MMMGNKLSIRTMALAGAAMIAVSGAAFSTPALAQTGQREYSIQSQDLGRALREFAVESGIDVVFDPQLVRGKTSTAVQGRHSAEEALQIILRGTDLALRRTASGGFTVASLPAGETQGQTASSMGGDNDSGDIVVTAQKREERLRDVPAPVTAVRGEVLERNAQVRLQDYFSQVPGLNLINSGRSGISTISIRGITTGGFTNASVGILVDEVPFGSSLSLGGGSLVPDFDPSDLERVEVLRGPQGTLYGATTLGGLVKYVTVKPSLDGVRGRVAGGILGVENGDGVGYNLRGAVNLPIGETLAIRASGFYRRTPGYIDDPIQGIEGINEEHAYGGRVSALWQPIETFSLLASALLQQVNRDGSADVQPAVGDLQQTLLPGTGDSHRQSGVYSAVAKLELGEATLTSVTGYNTNHLTGSSDFAAFGSLTDAIYGTTGGSAALNDNNRTRRFTQELRIDVPITNGIDLLVGGFFQRERSKWLQNVTGNNANSGDKLGDIINVFQRLTYQEHALFADATFKFSDAFDVQIGGRQSFERQKLDTTRSGDLSGGVETSDPTVRSKAHPFTFLMTPRYRFSDSLMAYARLASGYRPGGPNVVLTAGVPSSYQPDRTYNYEVGFKGDAFDKHLSFDLSLYYIDWRDIQLSLFISPNSFNDNAGQAKSEGVELQFEARPINGMVISAWGAYNNARLKDDFPVGSTAFGEAGDRLPFSSRWSGHVGIDQKVPLTDEITGSFGGAVTYVGKRQGDFLAAPGPRQVLPAYTQIDVRAGIQYDTWSLNAFATNLTDRRGLLAGGIGAVNSSSFNYIQPRTIGLSLSAEF